MFKFISNALEKSNQKKLEKNKDKISKATKEYLNKIGAGYESKIILEIKKKYTNLDIGSEIIENIIFQALWDVGEYIYIGSINDVPNKICTKNLEFMVKGNFSDHTIVKYQNSTSGTNYHYKEYTLSEFERL